MVGGQRFYERAEVKDVLATCACSSTRSDDVSLLRIINTPARGIGKTTIDRLLDLAAQAGSSVWNTLLDRPLRGRAAQGRRRASSRPSSS